METAEKVAIAIAAGFLSLIVGMLLVMSNTNTCPTGKTTAHITYKNSNSGEWIQEPIYEVCKTM